MFLMDRHYPNPETWRPWLGEATTKALIRLVMKKNAQAFKPLSMVEYMRKMVKHWWNNEFPGEPFPVETERFVEDFDL